MHRIYLSATQDHFHHHTQALFLSGPRQVGKTMIARYFLDQVAYAKYLNWDNVDHQLTILQGPAAIAADLPIPIAGSEKPSICFDEIHKYKNWKGLLKGFIDTYGPHIHTIVTGSAHLDVFSKSGDSLMGRYFLYRVHPFSVNEVMRPQLRDTLVMPPQKIDDESYHNLLTFGGFPDPFIKGNMRHYIKWQNLRRQQFFQEDLRDVTHIQNIALIQLLAELLKQHVGQLTSYTTLAKKIRVTDPTVRQWIHVLEVLYYCFSIRPWSKNIGRSLLKEPKFYLWDWSQIQDKGQRAENFIASHLLKAIHFWQDSGLGVFSLHFIRTKEQQEVDFLVVKDDVPWMLIEVKSSGAESISRNLVHFQRVLNVPHAFQVAMDMAYVDEDCFALKQPTIVSAQTFLSQLI